jgi:DNA-directed RNA polymerase subunit RPC12/RpoP
MAALMLITCPECKKQSKGPVELQGKSVRCKACGKVFAVRAPAAAKSAGKPPSSGQAKKPQAAAPPPPRKEDEVAKDPYQLTDIVLTARCPQCAAQLESEDAVVCLNCGYNMRMRQRMKTIRTYAHTPLDWTIWLAPGILCALAVLALVGLICFLAIPAGLEQMAGEAWWGHLSIRIYGSAVAAGIAYIAGKYAFRRLVRNPRPPEKFKKGGDQ